MNFNSIKYNIVILFTSLFFFNYGFSQDFTIQEMLNFKNLNKKSLEVYLTDKGYKFDSFSIDDTLETKSFKLNDFLDRIHFSNFTYTVNKSNIITNITYSYNRGILHQNHLSQIKSLKFKLIEDYHNHRSTREYIFENSKFKIKLSDHPDDTGDTNLSGRSYYDLEITYL
jgi:hypothetical protein